MFVVRNVWLVSLLVLCRIVSNEGIQKSGTSDVFFFVGHPQSQDVEEGRFLRLRCEVSPTKLIEYRWERNNQPIQYDSRIKLDANKNNLGDLLIHNVDRDIDSGSYDCIAVNTSSTFSSKSKTATVTVFWMKPEVKVNLITPANKQNIRIGKSVYLQCEVTAYPAVPAQRIEWYRNGQQIKSGSKPGQPIIDSNSGNLHLPMKFFDQTGSYHCVVRHAAGTVTSRPPFIIHINETRAYHEIHPDSYYLIQKKINSVVNFTCPMKNKVYFWRFTRQLGKKISDEISSIPYVSMKERPETIQISRLTPENTGIYFCEVRAMGSQVPKMKVAFHVEIAANYELSRKQFSPQVPAGQPYSVKQGENFILRFYIDLSPSTSYVEDRIPNPAPFITWLDPGKQIIINSKDDLSAGKRIRAIYGRHLHIQNAQPSDTGVYKIMVNNKAGRQSMNFTIVITFQPKPVRVLNSNVNVDEGQKAILECGFTKLSGYGTNHFRWLKNGRPINLLPTQYMLNSTNGNLRVIDARPEHGGSYKCFVKTDSFEDQELSNSNVILDVKAKLNITMDSQIALEYNVQGRLKCKARGHGKISIKWLKEDAAGRFSSVDSKSLGTELENDGSLIIQLVNEKHVGRYMCVATSNYKRQRVEKIVNVIVGEKPQVQFVSKNITVAENSFVLLTCKFTGAPKPHVEWTKEESQNKIVHFKNSEQKDRWEVHKNGSFIIKHVWLSDEGTYNCIVGNQLGIKKESVYVQVLTKEDFANLNGEPTNSIGRTIVIVVSCALSYLALIIGLTLFCSLRMIRKKKKNLNAFKMGAENGHLLSQRLPNADTSSNNVNRFHSNRDYMPRVAMTDSKSHFSGVSTSAKSATMYLRNNLNGPPLDVCQFLAYNRKNLLMEGLLGKGEFGDIYLARAPKIQEGEPQSLVIVKKLISREAAHVHEFQRQMDIFAKADHEYVGKLLGLCLEAEPQMLILEYCEWGDLKQFLLCMRNPETQIRVSAPTETQKITMCTQVAMAMEHLANLRITHRDLAARNILLTQNLNLKVSLLGLSRDTYESDYYHLEDDCVIPLRWAAPEVINFRDYTTPGDVWSFGIFVTEIFTFCEQPYYGHTDEDVLMLAKKMALRPTPPLECPADLQILLRRCWSDGSKQRPNFSDISLVLGNLTADLES